MLNTKTALLMTPEKLAQLKKDLKALGYTLKSVTPRLFDTVLEVSLPCPLDHDDRSNILAVLRANRLMCTSTSLVGSNTRKSISISLQDAF